jgi:hypothetical protein
MTKLSQAAGDAQQKQWHPSILTLRPLIRSSDSPLDIFAAYYQRNPTVASTGRLVKCPQCFEQSSHRDSDSAMKNVSAERVAKFFTKVADRYRVNKAVAIYVSLRARMSPEIPLFEPGSDLVPEFPHLCSIGAAGKDHLDLALCLEPVWLSVVGKRRERSFLSTGVHASEQEEQDLFQKAWQQRQQRTFKTSRIPIQASVSPPAKAQPVSRASQNDAELQ